MPKLYPNIHIHAHTYINIHKSIHNCIQIVSDSKMYDKCRKEIIVLKNFYTLEQYHS